MDKDKRKEKARVEKMNCYRKDEWHSPVLCRELQKLSYYILDLDLTLVEHKAHFNEDFYALIDMAKKVDTACSPDTPLAHLLLYTNRMSYLLQRMACEYEQDYTLSQFCQRKKWKQMQVVLERWQDIMWAIRNIDRNRVIDSPGIESILEDIHYNLKYADLRNRKIGIYWENIDLDNFQKELPEIEGVYVFHNHYSPLYVGKTQNLKQRMIQHHRLPQLKQLKELGIEISLYFRRLLDVDDGISLEVLEGEWIKALKPSLNGNPASDIFGKDNSCDRTDKQKLDYRLVAK